MFDSVASGIIFLTTGYFLFGTESTRRNTQAVAFSLMADTKQWGKQDSFSLTRDKTMADAAVQSAPTSFFGLRWGVSAMVNAQGTHLIGPGLGKTTDFGRYEATMFVYPSYSSIRGDDRRTASGHMNWRTTIDLYYRNDERLKFGFGVMHISNGGYRKPNNGLEALRFTLAYDIGG